MRRLLIVLLFTFSAANAYADTLYAVREADDHLIAIDTDTLVFTVVGALGVDYNFGGLAWDGSNLFMVDGHASNSLFTVNRSTGATTFVGQHAVVDLFGLAFDSLNGVLFSSKFSGGLQALYELDTGSGAATLVGNNPDRLSGLAYDSLRDQLVGVNDGFGSLYEVDRSNGNTTLLGGGLLTDNSGLAYDSTLDLFWHIDWSGNLVSYDPSAGYAKTVHLTGLFAHDGLAFVPDSAIMIDIDIDIKFCSDPNAFNCKKKGVLPVTIFGTEDFDVEDIDISSLQLCTEDLISCTNAPRDYSIADRGDPTTDLGAAMCAIIEVEEGIFEEQDYLNQDGFLDLNAAFEASEVQDMLGTFCSDVKGATSEPLIITGTNLDGTMIFSVPLPNVGTDQLWKVNK